MVLKRALHKMPDYVSQALKEYKLVEKYNSRPAYQKNDYIWRIIRAKREETRQKRLNQMIDELQKWDAYMKMSYNW